MSGNALLKDRLGCAFAKRFFFLSLILSQVIFFSLALLPLHTIAADDIRITTEFQYSNSNVESTNKDTGIVTESDFSTFDQNYNIIFSRQLYPFLSLDGGASFELEKFRSTSDEVTSESRIREIRPYVGLALGSPLYSAGILFRSTERKNEFQDLPVSRDFQKNFNTSFEYRPLGLPQLQFYHDRLHVYDDIKTVDAVSSQSTATLTYDLRTHPVSYTYRRNKTENRLDDFESVAETHIANTSYGRTFLNGRLSMNAAYNVTFDVKRVPDTGTASSFISPADGLFSVDNTPQDGPALAIVTELRDGNLIASSGINIGWADAIEADRNIGLDFGFLVGVDKLLVYVDREIPSTASNTLSWAVYTSPDNNDTSIWTRHHAVISPAPFGIFENRFELSFPEVQTRFIKVVVSPLATIFSGIIELENIFITEIEAFATVASTGDEKRVDSTHNFSSQLNAKLSEKTSIGYNLSTSLRKEDVKPPSEELELINNFHLRHIFSKVFSATASLSRDESKTTLGSDVTRRIGHQFVSNLRAAYLPTLSQVLSFATGEEESEEGKLKNTSLFLRTNAALYRGWDAFIDIGYSLSESALEGKTTGISLNAETSIVPNEEISLDFRYSEIKNINEEDDTISIERTYDAQASYNPFRYISFFARLLITERSDRESAELQTYSLNWSPFPDGDLQILLSHNESLRPTDDVESRSTGGTVRWNINKYATLLVSYFYTSSETAIQTSDASTYSAELDMNF